MWKLLRHLGIPTKLVFLIESNYEEMTCSNSLRAVLQTVSQDQHYQPVGKNTADPSRTGNGKKDMKMHRAHA